MTPEEVFAIWAPHAGDWSQWVKPVLFAHMPGQAFGAETQLAPTPASEQMDIAFPELDSQGTCAVVDLPGARSVEVGMALANLGFCPIPLFNAVPSPTNQLPIEGAVAVNVAGIMAALRSNADALAEMALPPSAPPAFLLDHNRLRVALPPGAFDNRSISLPADFPSANLLRSRGISRAVVLQPVAASPQADLTHTLLRWRDAGMEIFVKPLEEPAPMTPAVLRRPTWYRSLFHQFVATMGFRRSPFGGFGGVLPMSSGGG